jgi:hypothetical protein
VLQVLQMTVISMFGDFICCQKLRVTLMRLRKSAFGKFRLARPARHRLKNNQTNGV